MYCFGCLKQPTGSTGPAQRVLEQPAASASGTAKKAMEQIQPDPQSHLQPQPQLTVPLATRAPHLPMVKEFYFF